MIVDEDVNEVFEYKNRFILTKAIEWLNAEFLPLLEDFSVASSVMRTVVEHEAFNAGGLTFDAR